MDFEQVDAVFDVLHFAFHPNGFPENEDIDIRVLSLWNLFLISVGWTEEEYWQEIHNREHVCSDCGSKMDKDGNIIENENNSQEFDKKLN